MKLLRAFVVSTAICGLAACASLPKGDGVPGAALPASVTQKVEGATAAATKALPPGVAAKVPANTPQKAAGLVDSKAKALPLGTIPAAKSK